MRRDNEATASSQSVGLNGAHRVRFLLSGLLKCGCCAGGYTVIGKDRYGCATRRQKGTCTNSSTITRGEIEARVLVGLKDRLLAPELLEAFVATFQEEIAAHRKRQVAVHTNHAKELAGIERKIAGILKAIEDGMYNPSMKERMRVLEAEKAALLAENEQPPDTDLTILTHPKLAEVYRRKVENLEQALSPGTDQAEAMELIRSMIDRTRPVKAAYRSEF